MHRSLALAALLFCSLVAAAAAQTLAIGGKRFTEAYILTHILAQTAVPHARVDIKAGLGNTAIVHEALRSGSIDLYPEYLGTIDLEILKNKSPSSREMMQRQLAAIGLGIAIPFGFNNGYALAMREAHAQQLGIQTLSDLAHHPTLKLGLSNEFLGRADGWKGLTQHYGHAQQPVGIDHGLAYDALASGQVDVIDIYTTDAKIDQLKLRALTDDRNYFPRYDAVVLYRLDVPKRFPAAWQALQRLAKTIDEPAMIAMNGRAELNGVAFDVIARDFLQGRSGSAEEPRGFWSKLFGPDLGRLTLQHLLLVAVSVAVAALIGIPLAIAVASNNAWRRFVLGATGVLQTIPSLAMLAVLISLIGAIGTLPALVALTLYALLPIVRNTCTGLAEVPAGLKQAAIALGLGRRDQLLRIELPLAFPTLIAGVRTATVITVGTATIAAFIGAGGYGERIVTGLALNDSQLLVAGAVPAALLALVCEGLFEMVEARMRRKRRG